MYFCGLEGVADDVKPYHRSLVGNRRTGDLRVADKARHSDCHFGSYLCTVSRRTAPINFPAAAQRSFSTKTTNQRHNTNGNTFVFIES